MNRKAVAKVGRAVHRDLRSPKYRMRVVEDKTRRKRKDKHADRDLVEMVAKGTKAWSSVDRGWLEDLRGD